MNKNRRLLKLLMSTTFFLVLLEGSFQLIGLIKPNYFEVFDESAFYERKFLQRYERDEFIYKGLHQPHPTRGWTTVPNQSIVDSESRHFTINNHGHRSLEDYENDPKRFPVVIIGNSYTFGIDADDAEAWPIQLQARDARLNIANLAVGGYGMGQMYLTLRDEIARYQPELVVVAFIDNDLVRSQLTFRDYKKPRYVLRGDDLELTNTPIGAIEDVYEEVKRRHSTKSAWRYVRTFGFVSKVLHKLGIGVEDHRPLNTRIVEAMIAACDGVGAEFLLVHLAHSDAIRGPHADEGEEFLRQFVSTHDVRALETRPAFLAENRDWVMGHYKSKEAEVVARLVYERITSLPAWTAFAARQGRP